MSGSSEQKQVKTNEFSGLTYESMKERALDHNLAPCEKVGFPRHYREGKERLILDDILSKLTNLRGTSKEFMEIGPGCSELTQLTIEFCLAQGHKIILVDSAEMLSQLPNHNGIQKIVAKLPEDRAKLEPFFGKIDALNIYSVLQMIHADGGDFEALELFLNLLSHGGQCLIGDLPNQDKRRRFFSSQQGIVYHQLFSGDRSLPPAQLTERAPGEIGDDYIISLIHTIRKRGYDAYVTTQGAELPFANRREDILISRP